jgi:hypothetical protein
MRKKNQKRQIISLSITSDANRMWRCMELRRNYPERVGHLYSCKGKPIKVFLPSRPSPYCDGIVFDVAEIPEWSLGGQTVCSHQVDID